jgi:hypothetical protein
MSDPSAGPGRFDVSDDAVLLAADAVVVAIEVGCVPGVADANGRGTGRSGRGAVLVVHGRRTGRGRCLRNERHRRGRRRRRSRGRRRRRRWRGRRSGGRRRGGGRRGGRARRRRGGLFLARCGGRFDGGIGGCRRQRGVGGVSAGRDHHDREQERDEAASDDRSPRHRPPVLRSAFRAGVRRRRRRNGSLRPARWRRRWWRGRQHRHDYVSRRASRSVNPPALT